MKLLPVCLALLAIPLFGSPAAAQPIGKPRPAPSPKPLLTSGFVRFYDFTRQNASSFPQTFKTVNQASVNAAISLHAAFQIPGSPISFAATYLYANPFNGCANPASHLVTPCGENDDTLPGYGLSTLYEAYVQYKNPALTIRIGNQVINTPWANPSDSRLKPAAFQGEDVTYRLNQHWTAEAMWMSRFEGRATSAFDNATLLTSHPADAPGAAANIFTPGGGSIATSGFRYGRLGYAAANLSANIHYYDVTDIAGAFWLDAKYGWKTSLKPFVALQAGAEQSEGRAVIGKIASSLFGLQAGITPVRNLDLAVSYDDVPLRSDTLTLPGGVSCGSNSQIKTAAGVTFPYFLPSGGATNCLANADGTTTIYYGGWASPYTDSYATDPIFTTSISQGMTDRRSPGESIKFGATFQALDKRLRLMVSRAYYRYATAAGSSPTQETDLDGTWFFKRPPATGAYHGFSLRHRYAERTQGATQFYGGAPLFKYNRTQLEFDF